MKKILFAVILAITSSSLFGQGVLGHSTFMSETYVNFYQDGTYSKIVPHKQAAQIRSEYNIISVFTFDYDSEIVNSVKRFRIVRFEVVGDEAIFHTVSTTTGDKFKFTFLVVEEELFLTVEANNTYGIDYMVLRGTLNLD